MYAIGFDPSDFFLFVDLKKLLLIFFTIYKSSCIFHVPEQIPLVEARGELVKCEAMRCWDRQCCRFGKLVVELTNETPAYSLTIGDKVAALDLDPERILLLLERTHELASAGSD